MVKILFDSNISVFCFDFPGCGNSEGNFISLGKFESETTQYLLKHLEEEFGFHRFVLWGFSMGAATTLLVDHPKIVGKVVDSSFTSIYDVSLNVLKNVGLSNWVAKPILFLYGIIFPLRGGFSIYSVSPLDSSKHATVPALFAHSVDDPLIPFQQGKRLFDSYPAKKSFFEMFGGHGEFRTRTWYHEGKTFVVSCFENDSTFS